MKLRSLCALVAVALFAAAPLFAKASPKVGEEVPDSKFQTWIMNGPDVESLHDFKGDVVFVEIWGTR